MDDLTGHITKGYELREQVGRGGFGAVYRAFQSSVGREVAIKVILPQFANHPDFVRRFDAEAQLVARLEHPFIVPLFDYWRDPEGAYLVMRFLRGGSLRDILDAQSYSLEQTVDLMDQICGALVVAHRNGVVHRDLKPDNILLDDDGNAFLTDFGIAKANRHGEDDEDEESFAGSPGYMAPEQIIGNPVSAQTDIYSLGIMLYEIMLGEHPFVDSTTTEMLFRHLQEPLPDIDLIRADLPSVINDVIQKATAKEPADRFEDVTVFAQEYRNAVLSSAGEKIALVAPDDGANIMNPYKGLRPFEEADAVDFFGREQLVKQLIARLQEDEDWSRFLGVVGPSGSGKSSVVKAGLIPALRWGDVTGSEDWFITEMVPGPTPIENLAAALENVAINQVEGLHEQLQQDKTGLLRTVNSALPEGSQLLLFIDQFEEVFTLLESEAERAHFLSLIRNAMQDQDSQIRVIVTLRADFYDRPLLYEGFGILMRNRTEVVLPLSNEELERSITAPAERVGLEIESNLLTAIVADVLEEPGALPLLQYVLTELYERRTGRVLTLGAYQDIGGALGALAKRADELYAGLDDESTQITQQLFLRLVTLGEGAEDTRRRVQWSELMSFGVNRDTLQDVLNAFGKYRLLSFDRDPQTREPTVEVAHEALIREWGRLREWLSRNRDDVRLQRNLAHAASEWLRFNKDVSFVLRGTRLSQYEEWITETDLVLTESERAYLDVSIEQRLMRGAEEARQREYQAELERTSRNRLRNLVVVLGIAFVVAAILSVFAITQSQEAELERDNAQLQEAIAQREADVARSLALSASARQLNMLGDYGISLALALQANHIESPPDQVQRVLADIAYQPSMIRRLQGEEDTGHTAGVTSVAFSPDGDYAVSGSTDGSLVLWNLEAGEIHQELEGHFLPIASVAYSPSGDYVVSGSWDTSLIMWETETGESLRRFNGHSGAVNTVDVAPNGEQMLSGSTDGLILWDITTGEIIRRMGEQLGSIFSVAIDPHSAMALVGTVDNEVQLWDLVSGEMIQPFRGHTSDILSVAISPDGLSGISSSRDNTIIHWNLATGQEIRRLDSAAENAHMLPVTSVQFSPDGRQILSGSDDGVVILWDLETGTILRRFEEHEQGVNTVAFSPDGQTAISGSDDQTLIYWSVTNGAILRSFPGHDGVATSVDYSSDGQMIVTAGDDGEAILWDVDTGQVIQHFRGHDDMVMDVKFNLDSTQIVTASSDGTLILWDVESGDEIQRFEGHTNTVNAVDFSPDGTQIISASDDTTVLLWDVETGEVIDMLEGHTHRVLTVGFAPDGTVIVTGSADRTAIVWDVESASILHTLEGHSRRILDVAFSPDSSRVVTGSDDNQVILWDIETGAELRSFTSPSEEDDHAVLSVAYNPDGETVLFGVETGNVIWWNPDDAQSIRELGVPDGASGVESIAFSPDGAQAAVVMGDGKVLIWQTPTLEGLLEWTVENRFIPELTCDEMLQYGTAEQCEPENLE